MLQHVHNNFIPEFLKKLSYYSRRWNTKTPEMASFIPNNENLDLSYASYESTDSFSKKKPKPTPLLILHGLMGSKNNWNSICKKIHNINSCKVIALDARNHGESPHFKGHTYDSMVVDVRQFIHQMNLDSVNLLGHSMGGRTAMLFALKYVRFSD